MKLIALIEFSPDGSLKLKPGDRFEISASSARFLIATQRARVDDTEELKKKGKYERRDLRAED